MVNRLFIYFTLLFSHPLFSQGGWQHSVAVTGSTYNSCYNALEDPSTGNIVLAGRSKTGTLGVVCLIGLDSNGTKQWQKFYGEPDKSLFPYYGQVSIARCYDTSGFFVTVPVAKPGGVLLPTVIKFNWKGDSIAYHEYNEAGPNEFMVIMDMSKSVDGGYFMTGLIDGINGMECVLMKTDYQGNKIWFKRYQQLYSKLIHGRYVAQDPITKRIIITGYTGIYGANNSVVGRGLLLITDSLGNEIARPTFGSPGVPIYYSASQFSDGSIVACGTYSAFVTENNTTYQKYYGYICNFDWDGKLIWERSYEDLFEKSFLSYIIVRNDKMYLESKVNFQGDRINFAQILVLDKQGNFLANNYYKTLNDTVPELAYTFSEHRRKGFLLPVNILHDNIQKIGVVKTDSNGCALSEAQCTSLFLGIKNTRTISSKIYPNPTSGTLYLGEEGSAVPVDVKVFEVTGRLVRTLHPNTLVMDVSDLENGIYLLIVNQPSGIRQMHKIVVEK